MAFPVHRVRTWRAVLASLMLAGAGAAGRAVNGSAPCRRRSAGCSGRRDDLGRRASRSRVCLSVRRWCVLDEVDSDHAGRDWRGSRYSTTHGLADRGGRARTGTPRGDSRGTPSDRSQSNVPRRDTNHDRHANVRARPSRPSTAGQIAESLASNISVFTRRCVTRPQCASMSPGDRVVGGSSRRWSLRGSLRASAVGFLRRVSFPGVRPSGQDRARTPGRHDGTASFAYRCAHVSVDRSSPIESSSVGCDSLPTARASTPAS
jgi:hypothetical protein